MQSLPVEIYHHIFLFIGMEKCYIQKICAVSQAFKHHWYKAINIEINRKIMTTSDMDVLIRMITCPENECLKCHLVGDIDKAKFCVHCEHVNCKECLLKCNCGRNYICKKCINNNPRYVCHICNIKMCGGKYIGRCDIYYLCGLTTCRPCLDSNIYCKR